MKIAIEAAQKRNEPVDHILFSGPPGLGKTTLAHIIAHEMGADIRATTGPVLEKPGDIAALLTPLKRGDILFIDEIHRINPVVEEVLYPAMEDFFIDVMIGEGPSARSIKLNLEHFTLIGATTKQGLLRCPVPGPVRYHLPARPVFARRTGEDCNAECIHPENPDNG